MVAVVVVINPKNKIMNTVNDIRLEFSKLLKAGKFVTDKSGVRTVEIISASFIADGHTIFGTPSSEYINRELEWYKSMSLNVNDIPGKVPEIWKRVATPDGRINSNYGWCIWSKENHQQYQHVLSELIANTESRRAIMIYTRPTMHEDFCKDGMSDFICTNTVQYVLRGGQIHAIVNMRSNDAWAGYRNDRAWQEYVLCELVSDYNRLTESKVGIGNIYWNVGSLHLYSRQFYLIYHFTKTGDCSISKEDYRRLYPDSKLD